MKIGLCVAADRSLTLFGSARLHSHEPAFGSSSFACVTNTTARMFPFYLSTSLFEYMQHST